MMCLIVVLGLIAAVVIAAFMYEGHPCGVCPHWVGYIIDNRVRKWLTDTEGVISPYVRKGDVVIDFGCGHGLLTVLAAGIVGKSGRVYAVDLQDKMLSYTQSRANREGHSDVVVTKSTNPSHSGTPLAFETIPKHSVNLVVFNWVLHELPLNLQREFALDLFDKLSEGGKVLVVEPPFHVPEAKLAEELQAFVDAGFLLHRKPSRRFQKIAVLQKP
ncbi:methyltransferase type 11 [Pelomyxa schiedti]|nr:methyltransferase type 11 [Pelomyxa schiedti]